MGTLRLPLVTNLESRDGTEAKDGLMQNVFAEKTGQKTRVQKRFGTSVYASSTAGTGLGQFTLGANDYAIINVGGVDTLFNITSAPTTAIAISPQPSPAGLPYQIVISNDGTKAFLKTSNNAYQFDGSGVTAVPAAGTVSSVQMLNYGTINIENLTLNNSTIGASSATGWNCIAYGSGKFVAIGLVSPRANTSSAAYVTIGTQGTGSTINWTSPVALVSSSVTMSLTNPKIVYGNSLFVVISVSGVIITSPDGVTWTTQYNVGGSVISCLAYNGALFVALDSQYSVHVSSNGTSWSTSSPAALNLGGGGAYFSAMAWNGKYFVAFVWGGNIAFTSTNGVDWAQRTLAYTAATAYYGGAAWNQSAATSASTNTNSTTGVVTTVNINTLVCCIAGSNWCTTTNDGITFTIQTLPTSANWCSVAWNGSVFCMVANDNNSVLTSKDGVAWNVNTIAGGLIGMRGIISNGYTAPDGTGTGSSFVAVSDTSTTTIETSITFPLAGCYQLTVSGGSGSGFSGSYTVGNYGAVLSANAAYHIVAGITNASASVAYTTPTSPSIAWPKGIAAGLPVSGTGIQTGTIVATVTNGVGFTLSLAATATNASAALTIGTSGSGYTASAPNLTFPQVPTATANAIISGFPTSTVTGIAYLDSTYYIMDSLGKIYGSDLENPLSFPQLNNIIANSVQGTGMAISRYLNYVLAHKNQSTEVFYDAANNYPASPLGTVPSALSKIGCADGRTVVSFDNSVIWVSQSTDKELQVIQMQGLVTNVISTPDVDRILNMGYLTTSQPVYAFAMKKQGHQFYVLTIVNANISLVYDVNTGVWSNWSWATLGSTHTPVSLSYANGIVTVSDTAHGYSDGYVLSIAGATQTQYNGTVVISYIDANTYSYIPYSTPSVTPATGTISIGRFTSSYFPFVSYNDDGSADLLLHASNGNIYKSDVTLYQDFGGGTTTVYTWQTQVAQTFTLFSPQCIAWNGTTYFMIGLNGTTNVTKGYTSTDGTTWTQQTIPAGVWGSVVWNGYVFCIAGDQIGTNVLATSATGLTGSWTTHANPLTGLSYNGGPNTLTAGATGNLFASGYTAGAGFVRAIISTDNGTTWNLTSANPPFANSTNVHSCAGNNGFCMIGTNTSISYFTNIGGSWIVGSLPAVLTWYFIANNGTLFVALPTGATSTYATSTNGVNWTSRTFPVNFGAYPTITVMSGVFNIVLYGSNTTYYSVDGITWSTLTIPGAVQNWFATGNNGTNLTTVLATSSSITGNVTTSNNNPIDVRIRTDKFDGGTTDRKHVSRQEIIGDKVSTIVYLRYTDDDYQTWCGYQPVYMNQPRSLLRRQGSTRRRAIEVKHIDNTPLRMEAIEIDVDVGGKE